MVWMQKNADTTNKFSTEKERKKDMKTIYQIIAQPLIFNF